MSFGTSEWRGCVLACAFVAACGGGTKPTFVASGRSDDGGSGSGGATGGAADGDAGTDDGAGTGATGGGPPGAQPWAATACEDLDPSRVYLLGFARFATVPTGLVRLDRPAEPCVAVPDSERMIVDPVGRDVVYLDPAYSDLGVRRLVADPFDFDSNLPDPIWPIWNGALEPRGVDNDPVVPTPGCEGGLLGEILLPPEGGELVYSCSRDAMSRWYRGDETSPLDPPEAFYVALGPEGLRLGRWINTSAVFDADGAMTELTGEPITIDGDDVVRWNGNSFWLVRADTDGESVRFARWEITPSGAASIAAHYTAVPEGFSPGRAKLAEDGDLYAVGIDPEALPDDVGVVLRIPVEPDPFEIVYREDGPDAEDPFFIGHQNPGVRAYLVTGP